MKVYTVNSRSERANALLDIIKNTKCGVIEVPTGTDYRFYDAAAIVVFDINENCSQVYAATGYGANADTPLYSTPYLFRNLEFEFAGTYANGVLYDPNMMILFGMYTPEKVEGFTVRYTSDISKMYSEALNQSLSRYLEEKYPTLDSIPENYRKRVEKAEYCPELIIRAILDKKDMSHYEYDPDLSITLTQEEAIAYDKSVIDGMSEAFVSQKTQEYFASHEYDVLCALARFYKIRDGVKFAMDSKSSEDELYLKIRDKVSDYVSKKNAKTLTVSTDKFAEIKIKPHLFSLNYYYYGFNSVDSYFGLANVKENKNTEHYSLPCDTQGTLADGTTKKRIDVLSPSEIRQIRHGKTVIYEKSV